MRIASAHFRTFQKQSTHKILTEEQQNNGRLFSPQTEFHKNKFLPLRQNITTGGRYFVQFLHQILTTSVLLQLRLHLLLHRLLLSHAHGIRHGRHHLGPLVLQSVCRLCRPVLLRVLTTKSLLLATERSLVKSTGLRAECARLVAERARLLLLLLVVAERRRLLLISVNASLLILLIHLLLAVRLLHSGLL